MSKILHYKPEGSKARIDKYEEYQCLYFGNNEEVFGFNRNQEDASIYIVQNFTRLLAEFYSDLIFSEPPQFLSTGDQDALDEFVKDNKLDTINLETSVSSSYLGDAIYKLRKDEEGKVIVESISPMMYFPEFKDDNINELEEVTIAWMIETDISGKKETYVRKQIHTTETIENKLFIVRDDKEIEVPLTTLGIEVPELEENPIDELLTTHIPNYKVPGMYFGISDIQSMESMLNEADMRITQMASILDKHADPKMAVPPGVLDERGMVQTGDYRVFEVSASEGGVNKPEYITWDAKLDSAFKEIELIAERLALFGRLPLSVVSQKDNASIPEAAKALKLKFMMALKKAERKIVYYDAGLKDMFRKAGELSGHDWSDVQIIWNDGLPEDALEDLQVKALEKQLGIKSQERLIRERLAKDGLEESEIEEEVQKAKRDAQVQVPNGKPAKITLEPKEVE